MLRKTFEEVKEYERKGILPTQEANGMDGLKVEDFENILGDDAVGKSYARECFALASKELSKKEESCQRDIDCYADLIQKKDDEISDLTAQARTKDKEIAFIKNELLDDLDLKEGKGTTALQLLTSKIESKDKQAIELIKMLTKGEDIISGIESQADNMGIDLAEVRHWWVDARKLLDELEDKNSA